MYGWCYYHTCRQILLPWICEHTYIVADVIALADVIAMFCVWFLLFQVDVSTSNWYISCIPKFRQMLLPFFGWCYCQCFVADFQTTEADVITSIVHVKLMLLPVIAVCVKMLHHIVCCNSFYVGWCYCQVADGIATNSSYVGWCYCQVADGIATTEWWLADVIASGRWYWLGQCL